jgi:hypothetical protein
LISAAPSLLAALQEVKKWILDDEQTMHLHGESATIDGNLFLNLATLNERFHAIRDVIDKAIG